MSKSSIVNGFTRGFHKVVLTGKKHSPEILVIGGVALGIVSAVMACKATLKVDEVNKEHKEKIDKMQEALEKGVTEANEVYTEEDYKEDKKTLSIQTAVTYVKLYGPSVLLGTASVVSILGGHRILNRRFVGVTAAYTALDSSFKQYRGRLIERFGEELDRELRFNIKSKEIEETVVNEDGTETTVAKTVDVIDDADVLGNQYAFFFDEVSRDWTKDPEWNKMFLLKQQNYWNDVLKRRGHVFLNDVRESLGLDRVPSGQVVGWIYNEANPTGDNYIDFGIFNVHRQASRRFVNGLEKSVLIVPNCDGVIFGNI